MSVKTITVKEISKRLLQNEKLFILDVRNEDEFQDWKIEGDSVEIMNAPYFNLLDGIETIKDSLPENEDIIVVCAKGGSSEFVGDMIAEAGFSNVYSLEGGMKSWSEYLEPVKLGDLSGGGSLYQFVRIGKGCLSYLVASQGEALIVDTARTIDVYEGFAQEKGLKIKYIVDTHLHADHISGGRHLADKIGAAYYLPAKDAEEATYSFNNLVDGAELYVGATKVKIQALYTPGHTLGSTSLIIDDQYLLTGDILFVESIGRPDLAGKAEDWVSDLRKSLYETYVRLNQDLRVLPAHFSNVAELGERGQVMGRLGDLYKKNRGLQIENQADFRKQVTENLPPQPNAYQEIRLTNMGKLTPSVEEQREMEMGPNRCAIHE